MSAARSVLKNFSRSFRTTTIRKGGHDEPEGFPGANLPFSIKNRYALTALFIGYFGSGLALPFLVLRYHLTK